MTYKNTTPAPGIAIYEGVFSNPYDSINSVELVLNDKMSDISYKRSTILGDASNNNASLIDAYRTSKEVRINRNKYNEHFKKLEDKCNLVFNECLVSYRAEMRINYDIFCGEGFQLLKYESNDYFGSHYDSYPESKRAVSGLLYLNDDYEGGEIEFVNFDLKIKPSAGTVILFPPNYPYRHIAHPIINGTKYAIVTWFYER